MTIIAAVNHSREGRLALVAAVAEARQLGTDLVVVNLGHEQVDVTDLDTDAVTVSVVDRRGKDKEHSAGAVIDEIAARQATRLVIGVRRRTPVGKAILGSLSQRLLFDSPVPVLAVKLPKGELPSSTFDDLPAGMRRVTG
ncbi:MAG: universal stress protein [Intrasporangium sp.]|uniref:universal stress protein n=1 Tax=Intrasporangium sp. TaxID=1925024 RepID=UPI002647E24C|nr:universal stress protein [Intrasporangium sp.]MDN5796088.1 universal stress protein [Intrasporangium sp.]